MSEVDELIERLNSAYTPKSIFQRDVNSVIQRHAKDGQHWSILSSDITDGLIELGYVKVVRCGECEFWGYPWTFEYPTGQGWCGLATIPEPTSPDHYCGYGEPKEDTNA